MATIRKQYRGFKIRINSEHDYPHTFYRYSVSGTDIKGRECTIDDAYTCALEDIEEYLKSK
jgi:hypothetical protein